LPLTILLIKNKIESHILTSIAVSSPFVFCASQLQVEVDRNFLSSSWSWSSSYIYS